MWRFLKEVSTWFFRHSITILCIFARFFKMNTLFLDRDGVVNVQIVGGYVGSVDQFVFIDHFLEAMKLLRPRFKHIILVTNQQGIAKNICTQAQVDAVHSYLQMRLLAQQTPMDAIYCCPHLAGENCGCRKPQIGMALQAKNDFPDIDFADSVMVGDSLSDMQFAQNAGLLPVHVGTIRHPDFDEILSITKYHFDNLYDFAKRLSIIDNR